MTRPSNDEAAIRAVIEARAEALRTKNAERVVAHHAPDFVLFSLAPPLISEDATVAGLNAWFATWEGPLGYVLEDLHIAAGGEVAYGTGLAHLTGTSTGGEKTDLWFRVTLGLCKTGDAWKIAHEHESVPFCMDGSYKAAVDLKP
jgi:PhnB protein